MLFIFVVLTNDSKTFILDATLSANKGRSFVVDIVYVYDPIILKTIGEISEKDYFKNKYMLSRENPLSIKIFSMEILPGKAYAPHSIPIDSKKQLISCVVFADFSMIQGRINRKLIIGKELSQVVIYFDDKGINLGENIL